VRVETILTNYRDAELPAEFAKIQDGQEVQVRRAIPGLWKGLRNRCASVKQNLKPDPVMGKVAIGDNDTRSDAKRLPDDFRRRDQFRNVPSNST